MKLTVVILISFAYEWDRELKVLQTAKFSDEALENIVFRSAVDFFNLAF